MENTENETVYQLKRKIHDDWVVHVESKKEQQGLFTVTLSQGEETSIPFEIIDGKLTTWMGSDRHDNLTFEEVAEILQKAEDI